MLKMTRLTALFICVWLCFLVYSATVLFHYGRSSNNDEQNAAENKIQAALFEVQRLKRQNKLLKQKIFHLAGQKSLNKSNEISSSPVNKCPRLAHFSASFEKVRRSLDMNIREYWLSVKSSLNNPKRDVNFTLKKLSEQFSSVYADSLQLSLVDSALEYRRTRLRELGSTLQRRLHILQNPENCHASAKLLCDLNKGCGFGCQMHHVIYCFIVAYSLNRTLVLNSQEWSYSQHGWQSVFAPLSHTCDFTHVTNMHEAEMWKGPDKLKNVNILKLPIVDSLASSQRPVHLPLAIPHEWGAELAALHGNPSAWWLGQFSARLWRLQPEIRSRVDQTARQFLLGEFSLPGTGSHTVGVHVRRTDKVGSEAAFHELKEYMEHVDEWYNIQDVKRKKYSRQQNSGNYVPLKRRVFIATDDPRVVEEAQRRYNSSYEVLANKAVAHSARLGSRYSDPSLEGIVVDVQLLSLCHFIVCTFSSQVCRLAYELMQVGGTVSQEHFDGDMAEHFKSLDDVFYFGGQGAHEQVAVLDHQPQNPGEIQLKIGDVLTLAGNHWDGYSKGVNKRTSMTGLYPSFKVNENLRFEHFPVWPSNLSDESRNSSA